MTSSLPRQPWETDTAYQHRLAAWDASKGRAPGGNPTLTTTATPIKENELSVVTIPAATDISAEGQIEWLRQTGVAYRTLDDKGVATYVTVAAEGLRISRVDGDEEETFEEIVFPLAMHAREEHYMSQVCLQRNDNRQPWDICIFTAGQGTMTADEARDVAAQINRAVALGERLNGLAAR